ncbi:glycosyl hydrolase 108 family protein [uncultured Mailhella sp.]|uniref:glycoside hydrolase family 108 protein n=1 Tax=uncultured Mailhella sp. TaxID=1981031 RepID=UPI00320911BA
MGCFEKAHAFVERMEGGFVDDPADPGGTTNYGVSLRFLKSQGLEVGDIDGDGDIDADDIRALTPERAAGVLRRTFWDVFPLDAVPDPLALAVYDTAVNMGVGQAKMLTQKALFIEADGRWGPLTWAAVKACSDPKAAALAMVERRRERYAALVRNNPDLRKFSRGWENRMKALEKEIRSAV